MLQFSFAAHDFLYLYTHFHFRDRGRISTDSFYKINVTIFQFDIVNFQIKQFIIFQKFSWNSDQSIWGVTMYLTKIIHTKMSENKATAFILTLNPENPHEKQWKIHAKSVKRRAVHQCFVSRITRLNKRRTRNECLRHVFITLEEILKQLSFNINQFQMYYDVIALDVMFYNVQAFNS